MSRLGDWRPTAPTSSCTVAFVDSGHMPYGVFRLRYKPRALLEDEGIIPTLKALMPPVETRKRPRLDDDVEEEEEHAVRAKRPATVCISSTCG